jgi:hypothetical protein
LFQNSSLIHVTTPTTFPTSAPLQIAFLAQLQELYRAAQELYRAAQELYRADLASSSAHLIVTLAGVLHLMQQSLRMKIVARLAIVTEL